MKLQSSPDHSLILSDENDGIDENASTLEEDVQELDPEITPPGPMSASSSFLAFLGRIFQELFESYKQACM